MQDNNSHVIIKHLPISSERPPLFVIGDVHGCALELEELIKKARQRISDCLIVLVGDLFTKGPDPVGVYDVIQTYGALSIKGNHDWALISAISQVLHRSNAHLPEHTWQTLYLIRYHKKGLLSYLLGNPHVYTTTIIPNRKNWGGSYNTTIVHAGIDPLLGLTQTTERMLLTARWVRVDNDNGKQKLMLMHSTSRGEMFRGIDNDNPISKPPRATQQRLRWHEFHSGDNPDLIIFGHDAKQGLFRKTLPNGRPICVGLDTGCTYGRTLTGYFPESDDAIQVASHRVYFDMTKNLIIGRTSDPISHPALSKPPLPSSA